jgi:hypothetical protein
VLRHLFGPGEYGEHRDPRVVAAWAFASAGGVDELQPSVGVAGRRLLRELVELLEQPVGGRRQPAGQPVWHCSLHNHADDPLLSDQQWAQVAGEFMAAMGLAPDGDLDAVRWVAVRHGADHVGDGLRQPGERGDPCRGDLLTSGRQVGRLTGITPLWPPAARELPLRPLPPS